MIVELHLLQNVAPSCLNRDDANAPKDCEFGGHRRARISSQCIKRAIREEFKRSLPEEKIGLRSKLMSVRLTEKLAVRLPERSNEELSAASVGIVSALFANPGKEERKSNVLIYFDEVELNAIAEKAAEKLNAGLSTQSQAKGKKKSEDSIWSKFAEEIDVKPASYDIALFGRMLAEQPGKNVDGTCQVAHAISTNRVSMEFDFFTAVDDLSPAEEPGAGMMGNTGFNSSCFYRYAAINVENLVKNLHGDRNAAVEAVQAFIRASFTAMPTGKQNSFAAHNPPSFGFAVVRETNVPWSLANAFERPVQPNAKNGLVAGSIRALAAYWEALRETYAGQLGMKGAASILVASSDTSGLEDLNVLKFRKNNVDELVTEIERLITE